MMIYDIPILLVEWDGDRTSSLFIKTGLATVQAELCMIALKYPRLRVIYSGSPQASIDVIKEIKRTNSDPDDLPPREMGVKESVACEILKRLPGADGISYKWILQHANTFENLLRFTEAELTDILGNAFRAQKLHDILHK
jgi:DNA excision repair protein ERCC-4